MLLLFSRFSCVWLFCDPMDCSPPGSSVHGVFQGKTLECSSSRGSGVTVITKAEGAGRWSCWSRGRCGDEAMSRREGHVVLDPPCILLMQVLSLTKGCSNLEHLELGIASWPWRLEGGRPYKGITNASWFLPRLSSVSLDKFLNLAESVFSSIKWPPNTYLTGLLQGLKSKPEQVSSPACDRHSLLSGLQPVAQATHAWAQILTL